MLNRGAEKVAAAVKRAAFSPNSKMVIICFLLGDTPASKFYMPTFRSILSVPSSWAGRCEE
jgi:hypothetical protein